MLGGKQRRLNQVQFSLQSCKTTHRKTHGHLKRNVSCKEHNKGEEWWIYTGSSLSYDLIWQGFLWVMTVNCIVLRGTTPEFLPHSRLRRRAPIYFSASDCSRETIFHYSKWALRDGFWGGEGPLGGTFASYYRGHRVVFYSGHCWAWIFNY